MKYEDELRAMLEKWGEIDQIDICIEEMAELTKALSKYKRMKRFPHYHTGREQEYMDNVKEEIADVKNTVAQMQLLFGEPEIDELCAEKIDRTMKRFFTKN